DEPIFNEALDTILAACKQAGVAAGIHCGAPAYARRMVEKGFQFVTISTDTGLLGQISKSVVAETRGEHIDVEASIY
ncbi:MAG: 4-hydroxy-2-oxoheptanedioate aldolase, partial [Candidatus Promineifilaceae bacterium]